MPDILKTIKTFDAYPKTLEDFRVRTTSGAAVTIISTIFIIWLVISEFSFYLKSDMRPELKVDTTRGQKMRISFDITFPHVPCAYMGVDSMDASGEHQLSVDHNIFKIRLTPDGRQISTEKHEVNSPVKPVEGDKTAVTVGCGDCYGSEDEERKCCNTCEEVQEQYRKKGWAFNPDGISQCKAEGFTQKLKSQSGEGCRIHGFIHVNKVQGNFHMAPGKSFQTDHMHVHDLAALSFQQQFDLSHKITRLSFGQDYSGIIVNPLDGVEKTWARTGSPMYQYFIKIVPTTFKETSGEIISTNQYSVTEHERILTPNSRGGLPGVFFMYDFSPIMVSFTEHSTSFAHFLTSLCAIIGGVFTVAGIIDSFIYHFMKTLNKQSGDLGEK